MLAPDKGKPLNCCAVEFRFYYKSTRRGVTQSNTLSLKVILDVVWLGRERPVPGRHEAPVIICGQRGRLRSVHAKDRIFFIFPEETYGRNSITELSVHCLAWPPRQCPLV